MKVKWISCEWGSHTLLGAQETLEPGEDYMVMYK